MLTKCTDPGVNIIVVRGKGNKLEVSVRPVWGALQVWTGGQLCSDSYLVNDAFVGVWKIKFYR